MKMIRKAMVVAACFFAANVAYAQFGGLGNVLGGSRANNGGDISGDVTSFVTKSVALSALTSHSVTAINAAFSSAEEIAKKNETMKAINQITNPEEKQAKMAALYSTEAAEAKVRLSSGEIEKKIGGLDEAKKKQIGTALLNFGIGALQAIDLTKVGQTLMQKASSNPMNITKLMPVKDALPLLGNVTVDAGGLFVGIMKLAKGANISVPKVDSNTKPMDDSVNFVG